LRGNQYCWKLRYPGYNILILFAESTRDVEYSLFLSEKGIAFPHLLFELDHDLAVFSPNASQYGYRMNLLARYLKDL
jgi:hypothetical protein